MFVSDIVGFNFDFYFFVIYFLDMLNVIFYIFFFKDKNKLKNELLSFRYNMLMFNILY